ncbi:hypothetical protein EB235_12530 [Mesorhizobium loti R88b]|uniref:Uncharacterized protein n=1 Tax=Mesorhizobium loti R88b TaxID=935548 RepID=A0A6M7WMZ0_RHILI|nr:hypothetical protein EB235_12530 [Mesorhizobium loti R88b]
MHVAQKWSRFWEDDMHKNKRPKRDALWPGDGEFAPSPLSHSVHCAAVLRRRSDASSGFYKARQPAQEEPATGRPGCRGIFLYRKHSCMQVDATAATGLEHARARVQHACE